MDDNEIVGLTTYAQRTEYRLGFLFPFLEGRVWVNQQNLDDNETMDGWTFYGGYNDLMDLEGAKKGDAHVGMESHSVLDEKDGWRKGVPASQHSSNSHIME